MKGAVLWKARRYGTEQAVRLGAKDRHGASRVDVSSAIIGVSGGGLEAKI